MAFQSVPFTAEAVVVMDCNAKNITMTFYGEKLSGYDQTDLENLAASMDAWAAAELIPLLSTSVNYVGVNVRGLESITDLIAADVTSAGAGTKASATLSNQVVLPVKRSSAFTGRSARGRVYAPLTLGDLQANENFVLQSSADAWAAALNEVRQNMIFASFTEVIVSRQSGGVPRPVGVTFDVTVYGVVSLAVGSQDRRGAR